MKIHCATAISKLVVCMLLATAGLGCGGASPDDPSTDEATASSTAEAFTKTPLTACAASDVWGAGLPYTNTACTAANDCSKVGAGHVFKRILGVYWDGSTRAHYSHVEGFTGRYGVIRTRNLCDAPGYTANDTKGP